MWDVLGARKCPTCSVRCFWSKELFPFAVWDILGARNCSPSGCGMFWEQGTVPLRSVGYVMELLPRGLGSRRNHSTEYLCAFYFASHLIMHAIILNTVCIII